MEAIVSAHEAALLRYAAGVVNDPHAAQDVVQNAFIKLFKLWKPGLQPSGALRGWLFRVTHNEAIDYLRRERRLSLLHFRHAADDPTATAPAGVQSERMEAVLAGVRRLDPAERQVLLLRLQEGLSYREISQITGRTEGNVGCILHQAVKKLGRLVRPRQGDSARGGQP
jgi:RNA polymerase sigma-70 factor (ECF subfamily)